MKTARTTKAQYAEMAKWFREAAALCVNARPEIPRLNLLHTLMWASPPPGSAPMQGLRRYQSKGLCQLFMHMRDRKTTLNPSTHELNCAIKAKVNRACSRHYPKLMKRKLWGGYRWPQTRCRV